MAISPSDPLLSRLPAMHLACTARLVRHTASVRGVVSQFLVFPSPAQPQTPKSYC